MNQNPVYNISYQQMRQQWFTLAFFPFVLSCGLTSPCSQSASACSFHTLWARLWAVQRPDTITQQFGLTLFDNYILTDKELKYNVEPETTQKKRGVSEKPYE